MTAEHMSNQMNEYMGVKFQVEALAVPQGETFMGRFTLFPALPAGDGAASVPPISGVDDIAHPSIDRSWATENEALNYATQAAHSAIEVLLDGRTQGQGNRSVGADRNLGKD